MGGLRLILNVEQYEYMRSSREVAGAYGIVADQLEETSLVQGKGFAISKGTYTTVGLEMSEVLELKFVISNLTEK